MSKKRPRQIGETAVGNQLKDFKASVNYWRNRLFKGSYFYKGTPAFAKNWSVKIQYRGRRHTITLGRRNREEAAREAQRLYQTIVKKGWDNVLGPNGNDSASEIGQSQSVDPEKLEKGYWTQKLIHRQHTIHLHAKAESELSARIECHGIAHYFPLRTKNLEIAAETALGIFQTVVKHDWEKAFALFPRELTLAFRWSESPLAWTYTTIHTEVKFPAMPLTETGNKLKVAIAESDAGIRRALISWINRMEGFCCTAHFSGEGEAIDQMEPGSFQLLLCSQNLASQSGTIFAERLREVAPDVACLLYSSYEDSEELFRATPGGSGVYVLKRTPPTKFLEPIEASVKNGNFSPARMTPEIWIYFKDILASLPNQNFDPTLTRLTRREHEVLALLAKGFPDKEIADRLHISIWTVNGHVKNIFEKLNVHNRTEAVLKYLQK